VIVIIIAGGSGTRLWPLSTPDYPKHLLRVNGDDRSLLQNTYDRARQVADAVYVVSEASHIEHVKKQLPELPPDAFIVEPARRGTANCIALALAYVGKRHNADEPIAAIHADHYVRDTAGFQHSFKIAADTTAREKRLVLVGVEPDYPATGFGYIQKGALLGQDAFVFNVHSFKEKPDAATAQSYVQSGNYLWNCGYFVASLNTFKREMDAAAPALHDVYEKLVQAGEDEIGQLYVSLKSEAIDYALIEKVEDLLVVPASFDWMDVGTFADLYKAAPHDGQGNYHSGRTELEQVTNSFVQNVEEKPVVVIGFDNIVVVNTPAGILVAPKDLSSKAGDISKRL